MPIEQADSTHFAQIHAYRIVRKGRFLNYFVLGRFATIVGLTSADRERVVSALVVSKSYVVRSLILVLKTMGALLYADDDAVRARMLIPAAQSGLVTLRGKRVRAA